MAGGGNVPSGAGIGRLGVVVGAWVFGAAVAGLLDWSLGGIAPGAAGGVSGNRNSWLAVVSTLARMFVYSISIASLAKDERPSPLLWVGMAAAIAVCAWAAAQSGWPSWRMLLILAVAGTILYVMARRATRKAAEP